QDVYAWVFENCNPPPQILLRDYARGVIETAVHLGAGLDIDFARTRPPYKSEWPALRIPEADELKDWKWKQGMPDEEWSRVAIYGSVTGDSLDNDFSRYVIGDLDEWSRDRLRGPHVPTHKELYDEFVKSLTRRQRQAWESYARAREGFSLGELRRLLEQPDRP